MFVYRTARMRVCGLIFRGSHSTAKNDIPAKNIRYTIFNPPAEHLIAPPEISTQINTGEEVGLCI